MTTSSATNQELSIRRTFAEGDRVWIPPGPWSDGLCPRTGTVEFVRESMGALVRHDRGGLFGWSWHEIAPISDASWAARIAGRVRRFWWFWFRGGRRKIETERVRRFKDADENLRLSQPTVCLSVFRTDRCDADEPDPTSRIDR